MNILLLMILFQIKHLIVDFPMQGPYQYMNKGTYGHMGGIFHSGLHAIVSFDILFFFTDPIIAFLICFCEFLAHYHIDWAKMNLNKLLKWGPTTHDEFWWLLGFDQFLHQLTYILMIYFAI